MSTSGMPSLVDRTEVVVNATGGKGTRVTARYDLVPPHALKIAAERCAQGGAKYGEWNWTQVPSGEHIQHLLAHVHGYLLNPDDPEDHVAGAVARVLMWADMLVREGKR